MPDSLIRPARLADVGQMAALINRYAAEGKMLPRTEFELAESIRDFIVCEGAGGITGCAALHIYTRESGEVRSLAVHPEWNGCGIGRNLVLFLIKEAQDFTLNSLFAFTYVPGFFERLGFRTVERGELPLKAWKDCLRCPKFQACDEIAVRRSLDKQL